MQHPVLGIEQALLGFLWQRPMHAYELHQYLSGSEAFMQVWPLKQSNVYALLAKLEEGGYLASTTEQQGTRPPRRVFQLTPTGKAVYAHWVTQPVAEGQNFRLEFLARLFFATQEGPKTVATLLEQQRCACHAWLDQLQTEVAQGHAKDYFDQVVYQFRIGQIEAILCWLETHASVLAAPTPGAERKVPGRPERLPSHSALPG